VRIDAHQHYWRYDPLRDAWITDAMAVLRRDFSPADVVADLLDARIDGVVAIQTDQSEVETQFLLDLAVQYTFVRGVVGWVDLRAPDLDDRLAHWRQYPALKGFRHIAQGEPNDFLARPEVLRGIAAVGRSGFSYDILIYPGQLAAATELAGRCPGVRFVLDHCAKPAIASGEIADWQAGLVQLARHKNVCCKLSGLVTEAHWARWDYAGLVPYLDATATAFGPERLLFGSDWPVCLVAARYGDVASVIERWAERLTSAERALVFGGTAAEVYRLENRDGS
jgi:L-fuconolactonase